MQITPSPYSVYTMFRNDGSSKAGGRPRKLVSEKAAVAAVEAAVAALVAAVDATVAALEAAVATAEAALVDALVELDVVLLEGVVDDVTLRSEMAPVAFSLAGVSSSSSWLSAVSLGETCEIEGAVLADPSGAVAPEPVPKPS